MLSRSNNQMELDPRLQNLAAVDLHSYQFTPSVGFETSYPTAVYDHGLNSEQDVSSHASQHFLQDGRTYIDQAAQLRQANIRQRQEHSLASNTNTNVSVHTDNPPGVPSSAQHNQYTMNSGGNHPKAVRNQFISQYEAAYSQQQSPSAARTQSAALRNNTPVPVRRPARPATATNTLTVVPTSATSAQVVAVPRNTSNSPTEVSSTAAAVLTAAPASATSPLPNQPPPPSPGSSAQQSKDITAFTPPSAFSLVPHPSNLAQWRERFFNITTPILLTSEQYHTYFPHVDNIYSHRSTQKYKRKPFVSHYWDCRLKGRPTGTPLSKSKKNNHGSSNGKPESSNNNHHGGDGEEGDGEDGKYTVQKKRKRKVRERDLCDVKIKVTEYFGRDELAVLGRLGEVDENNVGLGLVAANSGTSTNGHLTFVLEDGSTQTRDISAIHATPNSKVNPIDLSTPTSNPFGVLEPPRQFEAGHPGAEGKRWYMVQRVNGKDASGNDIEGQNFDHKHTMEESDRIKKNSVQRWLLAQEKEQKRTNQRSKNTATTPDSASVSTSSPHTSVASDPSFQASGEAKRTASAHMAPVSTQLTLYANSFCPFAQRIWIALELKCIPYQYVEALPHHIKHGKCIIPELLEVCPEGIIPAVRHGNFGVWESGVTMEYLEDIEIGHSLLPLNNPQLRAHCRLWTDHINRKILPFFYSLLLVPATEDIQDENSHKTDETRERHASIANTLQAAITLLVDASHATGPFFLGTELSFVDVAFAPWIIRLSRVLSYYRKFPRPEVGTRWSLWVDAIERNECVKRTVSDERSYHNVYGGVAEGEAQNCGYGSVHMKRCAELAFAQKVVQQEGFGLGGDVLSLLQPDETPLRRRSQDG